MIRMPLIDEDIRAACRTESEVAEEIARLYREHQLLKNPAVFVTVRDFQSQPVAVLGAVNSPGRFVLQRRIRLLELVVFHAGGPAATAGRSIQVLSTAPTARCERSAGNDSAAADTDTEPRVDSYNLEDLLSGKSAANPYVNQGDIINLPAAKQVYVIGNVARPGPIPVPETVTLGRALALVGGTLPNSKKDKIRVISEIAGTSRTSEIMLDLKAVDKTQGEDFVLHPGDIVEVAPKGGFQAVFKQVLLPAMVNLPLRTIP
jgi:polysaccharide export outer membrane protein